MSKQSIHRKDIAYKDFSLLNNFKYGYHELVRKKSIIISKSDQTEMEERKYLFPVWKKEKNDSWIFCKLKMYRVDVIIITRKELLIISKFIKKNPNLVIAILLKFSILAVPEEQISDDIKFMNYRFSTIDGLEYYILEKRRIYYSLSRDNNVEII